MILVLLQNAWSPLYAGGIWPRASWLRALESSRSGTRLAIMEVASGLPAEAFWWDNTTPIVGDRPESVVPPDPAHVANLLAMPNLTAVVACGLQAHAAITDCPSHIAPLYVPHPAWRPLTAHLLRIVGGFLRDGPSPTHATRFTQARDGSVDVETWDRAHYRLERGKVMSLPVAASSSSAVRILPTVRA